MGLLISPTQPDGEQERLIFDCSYSLTNPLEGLQQYTEAHIPGAHFAPPLTILRAAIFAFQKNFNYDSPICSLTAR